MIRTNATVVKRREKFGISKSTVHKRYHQTVWSALTGAGKIRPCGSVQVNKAERHIRGGSGEKYLHNKTK